jgi:hypothetical protein
MAALGTFAAVLLAVGACGGQTIKQEAEPVTVTETVEAGTGTSPAVETTTGEESDSGQAGVGDTITLHGYEEGEELQVTVKGLIDPAKSEQYFGPRRGHKFVAVNLVLKNTGSKAYNDSPGNGAQLIDTRDEGYDVPALSQRSTAPVVSTDQAVSQGVERPGYSLEYILERSISCSHSALRRLRMSSLSDMPRIRASLWKSSLSCTDSRR